MRKYILCAAGGFVLAIACVSGWRVAAADAPVPDGKNGYDYKVVRVEVDYPHSGEAGWEPVGVTIASQYQLESSGSASHRVIWTHSSYVLFRKAK